MSWKYLSSDLALTQHIQFKLSRGLPGCGGDKMDSVHRGDDGSIQFQFPPKITTDSRKGTWKEGELRGVEPIAVFDTSGPREITIQTSYIVDSLEENHAAWTIGRITKQIRTLRGYFALVRDLGTSRKNLVVEAELWCVLPRSESNDDGSEGGETKGRIATGRIKSIDVKYGDAMVYPPGNPKGAFYLRSDVTIDFRLWTKAADRGEGEDAEIVADIEGLATRSNPSWY